MKQLRESRLPGEIKANLTPGAERWLQTNGFKIISNWNRFRLTGSRELTGAVLHYDILRPFDSQIESYDNDGALRLARVAKIISVVNIQSNPQLLASQISERLVLSRFRPKIRPWVQRFVSSDKLRADMEYLRELSNRLGKQRWFCLIELYRRDGWLNEWYGKWDVFIRKAAGSRLKGLIEIEPIRTNEGRKSFRVIDRTCGGD